MPLWGSCGSRRRGGGCWPRPEAGCPPKLVRLTSSLFNSGPDTAPWVPCHSGDPPSRAVPLSERMHMCPSPFQPPDRPPRLRGAQPTVIPGSAGRTPGPRRRQSEPAQTAASPCDCAGQEQGQRAPSASCDITDPALGPLHTTSSSPTTPQASPPNTPRQRAGLRPADPGGTRTLSP